MSLFLTVAVFGEAAVSLLMRGAVLGQVGMILDKKEYVQICTNCPYLFANHYVLMIGEIGLLHSLCRTTWLTNQKPPQENASKRWALL